VTDFLVRRDDLRAWKVTDGDADEAPGPGSVRLRVERFGLTANNLTYGLLGDRLGYWRFFAAPEGWGRIPAWGFGEVTASGVDGIAAGARFYGYFPMSSAVTVQAKATPDGFVECSEARSELAPIYNRYAAATEENGYPRAHDDANAIMRPLFLTGWLIADHLEQAGWFGAGAVVLASASSKTAFATAFELAARADRPELVGLTSPGNRAFTAGLGCYDRVITYDEIESLGGAEIVLVDMAGAPPVRRAVHEHATVRASLIVGATHWEHASFRADPLPGAQPEVFSAPAVIERRAHELGPTEFNRRLGGAWLGFADRVPELLEIDVQTGPDALGRAWDALVAGTADPRKGYVFAL
jgi:hypothetical protein